MVFLTLGGLLYSSRGLFVSSCSYFDSGLLGSLMVGSRRMFQKRFLDCKWSILYFFAFSCFRRKGGKRWLGVDEQWIKRFRLVDGWLFCTQSFARVLGHLVWLILAFFEVMLAGLVGWFSRLV